MFTKSYQNSCGIDNSEMSGCVLTIQFFRDSELMVFSREWVYVITQMETDMKANGRKANDTAKVPNTVPTEENLKETG